RKCFDHDGRQALIIGAKHEDMAGAEPGSRMLDVARQADTISTAEADDQTLQRSALRSFPKDDQLILFIRALQERADKNVEPLLAGEAAGGQESPSRSGRFSFDPGELVQLVPRESGVANDRQPIRRWLHR